MGRSDRRLLQVGGASTFRGGSLWTLVGADRHSKSSTRHPALGARCSAPDGLGVDQSAWWAFAASEADALVVGEGPAVWRALTAVWPTLPKPALVRQRALRPNLAMYGEGTLILQNIDEARDERSATRCSSGAAGPRTRSRIIATASRRAGHPGRKRGDSAGVCALLEGRAAGDNLTSISKVKRRRLDGSRRHLTASG